LLRSLFAKEHRGTSVLRSKLAANLFSFGRFMTKQRKSTRQLDQKLRSGATRACVSTQRSAKYKKGTSGYASASCWAMKRWVLWGKARLAATESCWQGTLVLPGRRLAFQTALASGKIESPSLKVRA